ncbi:potassium transporter [Lewinellaceae bacterium SD302]|nr:potassium transporter [Lewinellaceae bacterium SD302]
MTGSILFEAIAFLAGAIICVPLAKRLGLSAVLGYLLAGILIGPYVLGFVGEEGDEILHFAEFGVVMMLFLIGLEIDPARFWRMRKTVVGMGGLQVAGTMLLGYLLFSWLGYDWEVSVAIAMAVALSSTAIALQSLKEKGHFDTTYGSASFSILLFQDIIVILMLAVMPLLSPGGETVATENHAETLNLLENLPTWLRGLAIIGSVVLVVAGGRYLIVPTLRWVATWNMRELLTASALLIVLGISFLMELVGLSPALGAFLGGVVLANSEFRHELESTLEPFKELLLGLFFMAVGASVNFIVIAADPLGIGTIVVAVIVVKAIVLFGVAAAFGLKMDDRLLLTVGLAQIGEFAFVLLSFAFQLNILSQEQLDIMLVVTAVSMTMTPILGIINERLLLPNIATKEKEERPTDEFTATHKVILVGFGHFGSTVGRFLRAHGVEATILDYDSNRVDLLRRMGFEVYYGDATRIDLLESAGIAEADLLICTVGSPDTTLALVRKVRKHYPALEVMVRARNRYDATDLLNDGIENVYRETLDTSVKLASDALNKFGFRKYTLYRHAQQFVRLDEESLRRLAVQPRHEDEYVFRVREEIAQQESLLEADRRRKPFTEDTHWNSELRALLED